MKYALAAVIAFGTLAGVSAQAASVSQDAAQIATVTSSDVTQVQWHNRWRSHHRWGSWHGGWHNRWRSHHRWGSHY